MTTLRHKRRHLTQSLSRWEVGDDFDVNETSVKDMDENSNGLLRREWTSSGEQQSAEFNLATRGESNGESCKQRRESGIGVDWEEDEHGLPRDAFDVSYSGSECSSLFSSPCSPRDDLWLSNSLTDDEFETRRLRNFQPSPDPDPRSVGGALTRNRRSGFAFRLGDHAVPANAFVNTDEDPRRPKMLSVSEMMMKINADVKLDGPPASDSSPAPLAADIGQASSSKKLEMGTGGRYSRLDIHRFSLIGLRKVTSSEIVEDLQFLHCGQDPSLDLSLFEKVCLTWYDKRGRFCWGLVAGLLLVLCFRLFLALFNAALGR